ncbi:hypothetical protein [Desulfolutivibrio sulfoxidireducens]|uniref:hypothetical protein n=1 Tax=Desulfolutivibrio sulfoxidireducens TaxID=2773299 RepID=UPI00159E2F49|nr:hypothetical protein [Desulfolutivibrio sulfoxidireducens]QLA14961.1 hypothetical protein GD605_01745 [Desulfolutivibrio sulfoxidireducens]QLA18528.1 hypothetical protein GD604_01680 [Desulfolutivibrio sulfoxidireducens]
MLFMRTLTEKCLAPKYLGKTRRYRLTRGDGGLVFTGTLLSYHNHADEKDAPEYPGVCHMVTLALFRTRKGRFLVYYLVDYPEDEHISGQHQYVRVLPDFAAVERFVGAMTYVNVAGFRTKVLGEASTRLKSGA